MLKVGIITTHDVYNFGSSLQAYATQRFLEMSGLDAEVIDYVPSNLYKLIDFLRSTHLDGRRSGGEEIFTDCCWHHTELVCYQNI